MTRLAFHLTLCAGVVGPLFFALGYLGVEVTALDAVLIGVIASLAFRAVRPGDVL